MEEPTLTSVVPILSMSSSLNKTLVDYDSPNALVA